MEKILDKKVVLFARWPPTPLACGLDPHHEKGPFAAVVTVSPETGVDIVPKIAVSFVLRPIGKLTYRLNELLLQAD